MGNSRGGLGVAGCGRVHGMFERMNARQPKLPQGKWRFGSKRFRDKFRRSLERMNLFVLDSITGDYVVGQVVIGRDVHTPEDWGLPKRLAKKRWWNLARISPRAPLASGGTTALLTGLCRLADREGAWITTEVMTETNRDAVMLRILRRFDFISTEEVEHAMFRAPNSFRHRSSIS